MNNQYVLPPLPFAVEEVKGVCSSEQVEVHYEKHHKAYIEKTNQLLAEADPALGELAVDELIHQATGPLFNNVSQAWNHTFLWASMTSAKHGKLALPHLTEAIDKAFGSVEASRDEFVEKGKEHFGSGWLWLGMDKATKQLDWHALHDGKSPLKEKWVPLLAVDLWEHAYYIDYRNARPKYIEEYWKLVNWDFANANLK